MPNTGLYGPYKLEIYIIDQEVEGKGSGTYVLEREGSSGLFIVNYVGRSDDDLNGRLKNWCGDRYKRFKYAFYDTAKGAFEKECRVYHDFGGSQNKLDNEIHPDRSENENWECPVCSIFG